MIIYIIGNLFNLEGSKLQFSYAQTKVWTKGNFRTDIWCRIREYAIEFFISSYLFLFGYTPRIWLHVLHPFVYDETGKIRSDKF